MSILLRSILALAISLTLLHGRTSKASNVVRYETTLGSVDVRLYDTATPLSVANFLDYLNADTWDGTFIHRSVPGFVVQGGGFSLTPDIFNATQVTTNPPVLNEPGISNLRGTVAYAKLGGDPNSATSQWFFNLSDNSTNLDAQNGGFTVFGRVLGNGLDVIDSIAALPRINAGGAFTDVPVTDRDQVLAQQNIFNTEAVLINDVRLLDLPDGDYNFDGVVDFADLSVWENSVGSTVDAEADGDGNGVVDGRDFLVWQQTFGQQAPLQASTNSIPEPTTAVLCGLALLASAMRRVAK